MAEKNYQLELRLTITELDEHGRTSYNGRFEMSDTQALGSMPLPKMLEVMANIHSAVTSVGEIAARE